MPSAQHVQTKERFSSVGGNLLSLLGEIDRRSTRNFDSLHGRGSVLFAEGETARGIYILRTGSATVSISSSEGRIVILRVVHAGAVLGLNAILQNSGYEATVKTLEPSRVNFVSRAELLELVENNDAVAAAVIESVSQELAQFINRAKSLLLLQTACARFAQLLLDLSNEAPGIESGPGVIDKVFTHEELAQMIGSSRETVTRLLASLLRLQIIGITSDSIFNHDRAALEEMARS